ncbi:hypothetical protein ACTMTF_15455 [Nonomuraea sp. ZG12]|uniref:hypothetical protein n=1 Tax=Nonomuraea sp. ZG12 TaxID=3452207 RepID=UPI003F8ADE36
MTDRDLVLAEIAVIYGEVLPPHAQEVLADFSKIEDGNLIHHSGGAALVSLYDEDHPVAEAYWNTILPLLRGLNEEDPYA